MGKGIKDYHNPEKIKTRKETRILQASASNQEKEQEKFLLNIMQICQAAKLRLPSEQ